MTEEEEIEKIKRRKMMELMSSQGSDEEEQRKEEEMARQNILRRILEPDARERLARIKLARADIAAAVENQLILLAQSGRIYNRISDDELKEILRKLTSKKREIRIVRR